MSDQLPPYLASEVSSRILREVPLARELFNREEITVSGEELERLLCGIWLGGYADGVSDVADGFTPEMERVVPIPPLALWALEHAE